MRAITYVSSAIFFFILLFISTAYSDDSAGYFLDVQTVQPEKIVLELSSDTLFTEPIRDGNVDWEIGTIPDAGITSQVGAPALPLISHLILLGSSDNVKASLTVHDAQTIEDIDIWPFQQPPMRDQAAPSAFALDEDIYTQNAFWPENPVEIGKPAIMHGMRVAPIKICPLRFNPATRQGIWIRRAEIVLEFNRSGGENPVRPESPGTTELFAKILKPLILSAADRDTADSIVHENGAYLIITHPAFYKQIEPLVEWKRRKGLPVEIYTTEDTGKTAIEIRHFLSQRYYSSAPPLDYVLLVGDVGFVPTFYGMDGGPADPKYGLLEGDDYLPDVIVGRFPVQSAQEASIVVNKVIRYETEPPTETDNWYGSALMVSGSDKVDDENASYCGDVCEVYGGYQHISYLFDSADTNTNDNTFAALNEGVSWVTYFGHGSKQSWKSIDPHFAIEDVLALQNNRMLPVITSIACSNGAFDDDEESFAETWIKASGNRGAAAVLAASRSTPFYYTDVLGKGINEGYFQHGLPSYGAACLFGKLKMYSEMPEKPGGSTEQVIQHFILFSDPELNVWTRRPKRIDAAYPSMLASGIHEFNVTVSYQSNPLEGSVVHVTREGEFSYTAITDSSGIATFVLPEGISPGDVEVTILGDDLVPVRGSLRIQGQDDDDDADTEDSSDWLSGLSCG